MLLFLLLVAALIIYGSLYPFHFESARDVSPVLAVWRGWPREFTRFVLRDVVLNIVIYVPLGYAAAMLFLRRHSRMASAAAAIALAFGLSAGLEILQVYVPSREPSSLDVLTNATGGTLGALLALAAASRVRMLARGQARGAGAILLCAWILFQFYPFFPAIGRTHLHQVLSGLIHTRSISVIGTWLSVGEWLAAGIALQAAFGRLPTAWMAALAAAALGAQAMIADHTPTLGEAAAAAGALLLWNSAPEASRAKWTAYLLGAAILLHQLQPFRFLAVPQAFSWIPLAATLDSSRAGAVIVLSEKAFDYGALIFALRSCGWKYRGAAIAVAASLAITEAIQMYLPGRTPEITDPLVALLMTALLIVTTPRKAVR